MSKPRPRPNKYLYSLDLPNNRVEATSPENLSHGKLIYDKGERSFVFELHAYGSKHARIYYRYRKDAVARMIRHVKNEIKTKKETLQKLKKLIGE